MIRAVEVHPPSASHETVQVLESIVLIAIVSLLVGSAGRPKGATTAAMASFQVRFGEQSQEVQRAYRELETALEDLVRMRSATGKWPAVPALADELVEPFAPAPGGRTWTVVNENGVVNYVGTGGAGPALLLCILEPPPGAGAAGHLAGPLDEVHRRLADGTVIHVGVWYHRAPRLSRDALEAPQREGWTEVVSGR